MTTNNHGSIEEVAEKINSAFGDRPFLMGQISGTLRSSPQLSDLFLGIAQYVDELRKTNKPVAFRPTHSNSTEEPAVKKRKLNGEANGRVNKDNEATGDLLNSSWSVAPIPSISFSIPQRKKLSLQISSTKTEGIRACDPISGKGEFGIAWRDIEHVMCLPVPEKAQPAMNFVIIPKYGNGISTAEGGERVLEPMIWTIPVPKSKDGESEEIPPHQSMIHNISKVHRTVLQPQDSEFFSQAQPAHLKGAKSHFVKGFRGSKDGYLFFLSTGILWGFKKPLIFFAFDHIDSVSYTSILQRTFNLNITTRTSSADAETQEFEFSMLDQVDFAGIDAYVKRHGLADASMAEQRRAKKLNINKIKSEEEAGEQESELDKANREVEMQQDEEDEEEDDENFDPGSEGESEGEGTSEDEAEGYQDQGGDDGNGEEYDEEDA